MTLLVGVCGFALSKWDGTAEYPAVHTQAMLGISTYMNADDGDPLTFLPAACLHCGAAPARFVYLLQLADRGVLKRMARPLCASHALSENPARTVTRSEASWSHPAAVPVEAEPLMRAFLEAVDAELS